MSKDNELVLFERRGNVALLMLAVLILTRIVRPGITAAIDEPAQ